MSDNPIALFQRAAAMVDATVSAVRPDQFDHPTPCTEWTVRQLINHVLTGNLLFVSLATDAPPPDHMVDHVGDDHVASFRDSLARLSAVFSEPEFLSKPVRTPDGEGMGSALVDMRFHEFVVHSWDLAKATGQSTDLDHELVQRSLTSMRASRMLARVRGEGGPVGAQQPAPADANPADRLAAFMGRAV
ncbi:TIGR03086 family metal-binding protein [Kutzneria viridogrisea]|uniref:Uncharacterized protein (TIGR03086 family) n=1 Tax=Kutzneria viridogrisea TaxID=47990 RepID=A0ABR6BJ52_9PSEU|nr:uncharacterized protein (TIGR03086 family) [Kutzneria viridogrisea]